VQTFEVKGPLKVPTYDGKAAKIVDSENLSAFWEATGELSGRRGCYLFGIRASKGIRPVYVGRATKTFKQEVFTPHKLEKYQRCLADIAKGTPVLFFLMPQTRKGKPNLRVIRELEEYLIQTAVSRNPNLLNVQGTERASWGIAGVIRGSVGKPSQAAQAFKKALGLYRDIV
jgi:hypothetical protein